jgi:PAS domain S-box-containing protein
LNINKPNGIDSALTHAELIDEVAVLREKLEFSVKTHETEKNQLKIISKDLNLGFWEWDEIENRAVYYSEEYATIFGIGREELEQQYQTLYDFAKKVHPDDLENYNQNLTLSNYTSLKTGQGFSHEFRIIRSDGQVRHVKETEHLIVNSDEEIISSYGVLQDITELKLTVRALEQSEESYSSLFFNLPIGVQEENYSSVKKALDELDKTGVVNLKFYLQDNPDFLFNLLKGIRCVKVNQALLNLHGAMTEQEFIEEEEDVDKWWNEAWGNFFSRQISSLASNSSKFYEAGRFDTRLDGSSIETRTITSVVPGYEQSWGRVLTIIEDITDRKKDEVALIEAKIVAENSSQAKSRFLSNMSHELRTPLNVILGFSQLFEYDKTLNDRQRLNALEINRAGKHLTMLVDEVLDLSRIESGVMTISVEPVLLLDIINDSLTWVADMANARGISIDFDSVPFVDVLVSADALRLKQVFLNFLTNAIKYNHQDGRIKVVCNRHQKDMFSIGISDTGAGIRESQFDNLFQPFNRLGAELGTEEGTGIGLVITKQLVELMKGRIWVDSLRGKGSTFWIALTELDSSELAIDRSVDTDLDASDLITLISPSILVAEDNRVNQALIKAQLKVIGYKADYVENGLEALERWRKGQYDMLLTDINMPKMDGYKLIRTIRSEEIGSKQKLVIIAVSANAMKSDIQQCFDVGVDAVISKPVELEQLRKMLEQWNPKKRASSLDITEIEVKDSEDNSNTYKIDDWANSIDLTVLEQSVGSDVKIHQQLLSAFVVELPSQFNELIEAVSLHNHSKLSDAAHKLKSSSRSLGAIALGDICDRLESSGYISDWPQILGLMPKLSAAHNEVTLFVEKFCKQSPKEKSRINHSQTFDLLPSRLSVLVVDDDYIVHRVTTVILNDLGIRSVQSALSGSIALDIIKQSFDSIDVVICDLNMPGMDGVELMRHLANLNFSGAIIITSGEDVRILRTVEKLAIEHQLQVLGILQKPLLPVKIRALLEQFHYAKKGGSPILGEGITPEELKQAILKDEIIIFFQPKVEMRTAKVVGMEVLVRWEHPQKGIIMPGSFIPMAEENNLISALTDIVCKKALKQTAILQEKGFNLNIAINISVDTLNNLDWPNQMAEQIDAAGITASCITFEITESRLMAHIAVALDILSRLSLKRFNLSIDDFGTGYSSMEQLQRIPFSELKIDRAFVSGADEDDSALAIIESSILLAKKLDMTIVAEGVETQQEWDLMLELGCNQVQGYFISRPLPFDQILEWLIKWQFDHS